MIKEALEYLSGLTERAQHPFRVDEYCDPRAELYAIGGKLELRPFPISPRAHQVKTLVEITKFASGTTGGQSPCVFANETDVTLILDDAGHRVERVTFVLETSDVWKAARSMGDKWKNQKDFIRLLKIDLAGCLPENALLDMVRKLTFTEGTVTVREIQKTKESLGKSIKAEIDCTKEIPDFVRLSVPVYKSLGEKDTYDLTCSVEIDPTRVDAFRIAPIPDEIEKIQQAAVQSILDRLYEHLPEGVPCYYGSP